MTIARGWPLARHARILGRAGAELANKKKAEAAKLGIELLELDTARTAPTLYA